MKFSGVALKEKTLSGIYIGLVDAILLLSFNQLMMKSFFLIYLQAVRHHSDSGPRAGYP